MPSSACENPNHFQAHPNVCAQCQDERLARIEKLLRELFMALGFSLEGL